MVQSSVFTFQVIFVSARVGYIFTKNLVLLVLIQVALPGAFCQCLNEEIFVSQLRSDSKHVRLSNFSTQILQFNRKNFTKKLIFEFFAILILK